MSVKVNTAVVYFSRIYAAVVSIIILPELLRILGKEQYGLIGAFTVIQACLLILDAGVGGVLTRQSIIAQSNRQSFIHFNRILKNVVVLFSSISLLAIIIGFFISRKYSGSFFNSDLPLETLNNSVFFIFIIFALRYLQGPFQSSLLGYEKHIQLSLINIINVTISSPLALIALKLFGSNILIYFIVQIIAGLFGLLSLIYSYVKYTNKIKCNLTNEGKFVKTSLKEIIYFALQLSILSIIWIIVNQSDKLTLLKYMKLEDYAVYGVALSLLGMIGIFTSTMLQIVRPRLIHLYNKKDFKSFSVLYKNSFSYISAILIPLAFFMLFYGGKFVYIWTGDLSVSQLIVQYLPYLFFGGLFAALSEFCFILLYSHGKLKNHTYFYFIASLIIVPLNIYIASHYFGQGSAVLFMIFNLLMFLIWSLYNIQKYFYNGIFFICSIIISFSLVSYMILKIFSLINFTLNDRITNFMWLFFVGAMISSVCYIIYQIFLSRVKLEYRIGIIE